jgi:hypothetical protein
MNLFCARLMINCGLSCILSCFLAQSSCNALEICRRVVHTFWHNCSRRKEDCLWRRSGTRCSKSSMTVRHSTRWNALQITILLLHIAIWQFWHWFIALAQLKDLEKLGPKKGVISQSVKDVIDSLVGDDLVFKDKIGTSVSTCTLLLFICTGCLKEGIILTATCHSQSQYAWHPCVHRMASALAKNWVFIMKNYRKSGLALLRTKCAWGSANYSEMLQILGNKFMKLNWDNCPILNFTGGSWHHNVVLIGLLLESSKPSRESGMPKALLSLRIQDAIHIAEHCLMIFV